MKDKKKDEPDYRPYAACLLTTYFDAEVQSNDVAMSELLIAIAKVKVQPSKENYRGVVQAALEITVPA